MKRILLITFLFILSQMKMQAQKEISINGVNGAIKEIMLTNQLKSSDMSIKFGAPLTIKITGVNPFLHKVEVLDSTVSLKYELPTKLMSTLSGIELDILENLEILALDGGTDSLSLAEGDSTCICQRELNETVQLLLAATQNPGLNEVQLKGKAVQIVKDQFKENITYINNISDQNFELADILFNYLLKKGCCMKCGSDEEEYKAYAELVQAITKLFNAIMQCSFVHTTDVVYPKGDEHDFNIRITPIDSLEYGTGNINRNQHLRYWTKNKFNINLSGGVGFSGLQNNSYSFFALGGADSTNKKIVLQNRETFRYGASIGAHFYSRLWYNVNPAFSLGVLYDSEKKINPTAGLSLIFGHRSRLVLSGGLAMGKETRLAKGYEEEVYYENMEEDVPTREVNRVTWYCGLTFNTSVSEMLSGRRNGK